MCLLSIPAPASVPLRVSPVAPIHLLNLHQLLILGQTLYFQDLIELSQPPNSYFIRVKELNVGTDIQAMSIPSLVLGQKIQSSKEESAFQAQHHLGAGWISRDLLGGVLASFKFDCSSDGGHRQKIAGPGSLFG